MPKISNVYSDKKRKTWYFVASLGFDESGKRLQHWERGFKTQKEAKDAYDRYKGVTVWVQILLKVNFANP